MNALDESQLIPELGDLLTIVSDLHKSTTGRIIYRDGSMIRIRPSYASDRAIEFPLDPATGLFQDSLGVTELILHEKAKYPHYSRQLGVMPGEGLEFYGIDGQPSADPGIIATILADDTQDAIQLEDGRILNFGFLGAPAPYTVIIPRSAPEENDVTNNDAELIMEEEQEEFPEIVLPAPLVEEIPSSERTYSDSVQREDMFVSLLLDIPFARQKNPRILRRLYRNTDLLLALKNSMVVRDDTGSVLADQAQSYIPNTVSDLLPLQVNGATVSALLPIADVKKVVYTDDAETGVYDDVDVRADVYTLLEATTNTTAYREQQTGNPFLSYMDFLLARNLPAVTARGDTVNRWIQMDQDVLRSRIPPASVQGFPAGLPPAIAARKDDTVALTTEYLGTIQDSSIRLLAATKITNRKTGDKYQIAPADSGEVVDYVLLSSDVLGLRTPTRSAALLWDIQASEASRRQTATFYKQLMKRWKAQQVVGTMETGDLADLLADRLSPALSIASRPIIHTLDSFGMRNLELNAEVMELIAKSLLAGRTAWDEAMTNLRKRAIHALSTTTIPIPSPISEGNPLWTKTVEEQSDISHALQGLQNREPTLGNTHSARTAYMLSLANGTLTDVWYAVAAAETAAIAAAAETYRAERRRLERATANQRAAEAAIAAAPTVNDCQHVYLLESIRSIRDEAKRYAVMQDFLSKYQGGTRGNWVVCGSCEKHLVCRHELLLLHEFLHPGRSVALHKTLLLEFSGPVFEGAYICKNCGQKIAELEFDSHLEFDDEGRPLIGRTAVPKEGEEEEDVGAVVLADEAKEKDGMSFTGDDLKHYYIVRSVLEHCGITPIPELYERMIKSVRNFMSEKVPSAEFFNAMRRKAEAEKRPHKLPPYDVYIANTYIGIIGALTVMEIQTGDFAIPFPAHGCKLERGGFPLEKDGMGTITYVACVIAGVLRNDAPWNMTTWTSETSIPKRQAMVASDIKQSLNLFLAIPNATGKAPAPVTTVTDLYKTALDAKRESIANTGMADDAEMHVSADRLPPAFRPIPIPKGREETTAVPNASKLQQDVREGPIPEVKAFVARRQQDVMQETLQTFHKASLESARSLHILSEGNARSDAACCYQRLGAVALVGHGIQSLAESMGEAKSAEVLLLEESARRLRQRDSAASSNGTHIYVPWSAPITRSELPQADPTMYYKLFVKNCFRGENIGFPHEYGLNWVCRHCKYACPSELEYLTGAELGNLDGKKFQKAMDEMEAKRQQLAIGSLEGQVSEENFHQLEDSIHNRKSVTPFIFPSAKPFGQILESMRERVGIVGGTSAWEGLQKAMSIIEREGLMDSSKRRNTFSGFVKLRDDMLESVKQRMLELLGPRPSETMRNQVSAAMDAMEIVTKVSEGAQGARNIITFIVVPMEQIASGYLNEKPRVNKWFPKVAKSHRELLHSIWDAQNGVVKNGQYAFGELKDNAKPIAKDILERVSDWLGNWMQYWLREFRPTPFSNGFTPSESAYVLHWSILQIIQTCIRDDSPFMAGVATDIRKGVTKFFQGFFMDAFRVARAQVEKTQLTAKQISEAILARQELERAEFIRRFDVLDRDMRKVELIKKRLKIGDWAVGTMKNLFQYDADFFEFERGQRAAMGLPEFTGDITGDFGTATENPYGFMEFGRERVEVGVNDHRPMHDEDMI